MSLPYLDGHVAATVASISPLAWWPPLVAACRHFHGVLASLRAKRLESAGVVGSLSLAEASALMAWGGHRWGVAECGPDDPITALVHLPTGAVVILSHSSIGWIFFNVGQTIGRPWVPGARQFEAPPAHIRKRYAVTAAKAVKNPTMLIGIPKRTGNWRWRRVARRLVVWNTHPSAAGEQLQLAEEGFLYISGLQCEATWHDREPRICIGCRQGEYIHL